MSEKSFYVFLAVLAAIVMAILSAATVGQVHNNTNLRAELVATRAAMDSAAILVMEHGGHIVLTREPAVAPYGKYSGPLTSTATVIRINHGADENRMAFYIFEDGTVVTTVAPPPPGDEETRVANWGNVEKWR
jgi:hypothetical protein